MLRMQEKVKDKRLTILSPGISLYIIHSKDRSLRIRDSAISIVIQKMHYKWCIQGGSGSLLELYVNQAPKVIGTRTISSTVANILVRDRAIVRENEGKKSSYWKNAN
jgi:hypothetical protein